MKTQIPNIMSIDDHVIKINLAKNKVKNSIFEMADAITNALNQLENRQVELAQKLGMSKGTLSKWHSIGSNNNIMGIRELAPPSFDSLYQLSVLDNQKFNSEIKLSILVKSKLHFNTIIIIPSDSQIHKWKNFSSIKDINYDYPIRRLEGLDENIFQQCLIKVKAKHIDTSINCLNSWGYKYNKIMVPKQPKSGLVDLSSKFVLVVGSKGLSKNNRLTIKSDQSTDLIYYAKKTGNSPFLFIGEVVNEKNWMYCIN